MYWKHAALARHTLTMGWLSKGELNCSLDVERTRGMRRPLRPQCSGPGKSMSAADPAGTARRQHKVMICDQHAVSALAKGSAA